jgi:hypothetical protein
MRRCIRAGDGNRQSTRVVCVRTRGSNVFRQGGVEFIYDLLSHVSDRNRICDFSNDPWVSQMTYWRPPVTLCPAHEAAKG